MSRCCKWICTLVPEEIRCIFFLQIPTAHFPYIRVKDIPALYLTRWAFYTHRSFAFRQLLNKLRIAKMLATQTILRHFTSFHLPQTTKKISKKSTPNRHWNGVIAVSGTGRWGKEAQCSTKGNMPQGPPKSASAGIHASTYLGSGYLLQVRRTPSYLVIYILGVGKIFVGYRI